MSVEKRGTKALEYWAKRATKEYDGVNIVNMTTSWRDGRAFCALIHHFRPDLIDFDSLKAENILENNALAYKVAEQHLGIPALLDAEDMLEYAVPDRLSILTYVSQYYQAFNDKGLLQTANKKDISTQNSKNTSKTSSPLTPQKTPVLASSRVKPVAPSPVLTNKKETEFKTDKVAGGIRLKREECQECHKPVFLAEKILVGDPIQLRHRTCFRCARCSSQLNLSNYYVTEKGQFCCETCPDEEKSLSSEDTNSTKTKLPAGSGSDTDLESDSDTSQSSEENPLDSTSNSQQEIRSSHSLNPRTIFLQQIIQEDSKTECTVLPTREDIPDTNDIPSTDLLGPTKPPRSFSTNNVELREKDVKSDTNIPPMVTPQHLPDTEMASPGIVSNRLKIFENKSIVTNDLTEPSKKRISTPVYAIQSPSSDARASLPANLELELIEGAEKCLPIEDQTEPIDVHPQIVTEVPLDLHSEVEEPQTCNKEIESDIENPSIESITPDKDNSDTLIDSNPVEEIPSIEIQYPDDLNPFGSEHDESSDETTTPKPEMLYPDLKEELKPDLITEESHAIASLNPFDSGEDDDEAQTSISDKTNLNPFWSDDEENLSVKPKVKPPRPPPPTLKRTDGSLSLMNAMATPSKMSSPVPPSPSLSYQSTTPGGLRIRKKLKVAPTPPGMSPVKILARPSTQTNEDHDDIMSTKIEKNKKNMSNKMNGESSSRNDTTSTPTKKVISAPKFEMAEWRRKKGPAPQRPVPQKRSIRKLPMRHVQQELEDIDIKQTELERQGVLLETAIRNKTEPSEGATSTEEPSTQEATPGIEVEDMILQLFELVNEKNELFRRQTELMYLKREKRLEEEHAELEYQIRCVMAKNSKTAVDTEREEELIVRLMKVVEQRDQIVNCLELERQREVVEDESIANHMIKYQEKYIDGVDSNEELDKHATKKKKKKRLKLLKKKKKTKEEKTSKRDADKDVDETEVKSSKVKKKHWFQKSDNHT